MSASTAERRVPRRLLFRLMKGLIYGIVVGIVFAFAIYLLASAVTAIVALPANPAVLAAVILAACTLAGVGAEYSEWLEGHE
jgi:predicted PurR-regulated permease PerM